MTAPIHPDPPGVSGELIPRIDLPSDAAIEKPDIRACYYLANPARPGISPAALEAGINAAIVRDLLLRAGDLEALKADPLWWRVAIHDEPGGKATEVDTPSGWIMADWRAYADRYHGIQALPEPIAELPKARAPVNLDDALAAACDGAGISPEVFRSLLSPEDLDDIAAGDIHPRTLHAFAMSFAQGIAQGRIVVPGEP